MITVRKSTPEFPLTVIDHIADLEHCHTVTDVKNFGEGVPLPVRTDERFTRAVAKRLAAIKDRKAVA